MYMYISQISVTALSSTTTNAFHTHEWDLHSPSYLLTHIKASQTSIV